jgi:small GTP-binding protein
MSTEAAPPPGVKEYRLKLVVVGHLSSGKTSIIKRFVNNFFSRTYKATVGVDFALKVIDVDARTRVHLQLWDIAGQERFGAMTKIYYKNAVGALIVYDLNERRSFDVVDNWRRDIEEKLPDDQGARIPIMMIGNKKDLIPSGTTGCASDDEVEKYMEDKKNVVGWHLVSAKENENVTETIFAIVEQMVAYVKAASGEDSGSDDDIVRPGTTQSSNFSNDPGCCFGGQSHQAKFE